MSASLVHVQKLSSKPIDSARFLCVIYGCAQIILSVSLGVWCARLAGPHHASVGFRCIAWASLPLAGFLPMLLRCPGPQRTALIKRDSVAIMILTVAALWLPRWHSTGMWWEILGVVVVSHAAIRCAIIVQWLVHHDVRATTLTLILAGASFYVSLALWMTEVKFCDGDEPYYLIMAESLVGDGDFDLSNNLSSGHHRDYYPWDLKEIYYTHGELRVPHQQVGLPILLAPGFFSGGYIGASVQTAIAAALWLGVLFRLLVKLHLRRKAALLAVICVGVTMPAVIYSHLIYPEIPAALFVSLALLVITPPTTAGAPFFVLLSGIILVILKTRFILISGPLLVMLLIQRNRLARRRRWTRTAAMGLTLALLSGAFMVFQGRIFLWMRLVEAARLTTERISWLRNGIGLAIDQQYGLLSYSPVWLAAVAGSLVRGKNSRRIRIYSLLSLPYIAGLCLVDFWTGGWSPATRFLTVVIPFWIPALARGIDVLLRQNCRWTVVTLSVLSALATSMVLIAPSWAIAPTDPPSTSNRWMAAIGATASMPLTCMLPSAWRMNGIFWSALPVLVIAAVVHRRLLRNSMKFSPSCWGTCLIGCLLLVLAYLPSRATSVEWTLSDLNTINGLESCLSPRGTLVGSHCRIDVPGMASSTTSTYRIAVGRANCCPLESIQQTLEFRTGPNREARNYSIWSDEMTYWQIHTHEGESNDVLSCTASGAAAGVEIRSIEMFQHRPHLSQLHQFMAQKLRCVLPEWEYLALLRRAACYDPGNRTAKHLALNHILSEKKYLKAVRTFPELISSPPEATPEIARARLALLAVLLAPQSEQDSSCPQLHDLAMAGWHEKALACLRAGDANAAAQLRRETTGDSVLDAAIALLSGDSQQAEVILNHRWNEGSITAWELQLFSELLRGSGRSAHVNAMLNRRLPAITTDYYGVSDFFHEGGLSEGSAWKLTTFGGIYRLVALADGPQIITLRARGEPARHEWPVVIILIDGQAVSRITLDNDDFFNTYLKLDLAPGIHLLEIQYVNDYSYAKDQQDRNAVIERIVIDHPVLRALALQ